MEIRSYKKTEYGPLKEVLELSGLFDEEIDTEENFSRKTPEDSIIVALDGTKMVGCIMFTWDGHDSSIYKLCVLVEYRNQGLGRVLLAEAESRLRHHGARTASLRVNVNNKDALDFFAANGYEEGTGPYYDFQKRLGKPNEE